MGEEELSFGGTDLIMGPRESSDAFYEGLERPDFLRFQDQRLFINQVLPHPFSYLELRKAQTHEFELIVGGSNARRRYRKQSEGT